MIMNSDPTGSRSSPDDEAPSAPSQNNDNDDTSLVGGVSPYCNSQTVGHNKSPKRKLPTAGDDESGQDNDAQLEAENDTRKAKGLADEDNNSDSNPAVAADGSQSLSSWPRNAEALRCDEDEDDHDDDDNDDVNTTRQRHEATFPQKLMQVIEKEARDGATVGGEPVLDWGEEGKSFLIRDKAMFERRVLPRHFTAKCKFMSFIRKLYRQVLFIHLIPSIISHLFCGHHANYMFHVMHVFLLTIPWHELS
jgi:hypothetical protein